MTPRQPLPDRVAVALRADLPAVSEEVVADVIAGVPSYHDALSGVMGTRIRQAVQVALDGFLVVAARDEGPATPRAPALDGAYQLGRGEAREGRTPEALLAAYRIGARTAWRHMSTTALGAGIGPQSLAEFAELVFLYIDELSDASAAGHTDEQASSARARRRLLDQLARHLLRGASPEVIDDAAERAEWKPPTTLTALLCPAAQVGTLIPTLPAGTLVVDDLDGLPPARPENLPGEDLTALLVPDMHDSSRAVLRRATQGRSAILGPARSWREAHASYARAVRSAHLGLVGDTDEHLVELVLSADPEAREDLRSRALAPLRDLRPATVDKLTDTLRAWLVHQGRRDAVAAELFVHPQTVRYRLGQLRQAYGDRLDDPETLLALTVALALPQPTPGDGDPPQTRPVTSGR